MTQKPSINTKKPLLGVFDYVIIGAGSAGCLLANRLSAHPANRVLLIEAGGQDSYPWIHIPVGYLYTMNNPRTDWCLQTTPQPGLNGRLLAYPRGKVLGGCSSINGMIYMRGQSRDYDQWRQMGAQGWSWEDVLPIFMRTEDQVRGANQTHGVGGEWRVEEPRISWEILNAFQEAAAQSGIPKTDDFNTGNNEGCGYFQVNQRKGRRWNTAQAFLKPIKNRANLRIITRAHSRRVLIKDGVAVGVEFDYGDKTWIAQANAEVVLSAGAIASPQLLMLSGVGPAQVLKTHGIEVLQDVQELGANLQDHLQLRLSFKVSNTTTLNELSNSLIARGKMGMEYLLFRRGPLTMAPSQLGCFAKSDPAFDTPNLQYHIQPLSTEKLGDALDPFPGITASVCNLRPLSRGRVSLKDSDPYSKPLIDPAYLSEIQDLQVAADSIRLTRRIMAAPAMAAYQPREFRPGPAYQEQDELFKAAGEIGSTIFHPVGTCRMGEDGHSVVDSRLRLRGVRRLRVVDASIMPTITSGNTNAPTIMIAEKGAQMILDDNAKLHSSAA